MPDKPILLRQLVPLTSYKPRAYLNGFPKAGIHMLEQMIGVLLNPSEVGRQGHWLGTYRWHSWSMEWQSVRNYVWRFSCMERGRYLIGHSGYHEDIERMFRYGNIAHIFLYRDLRDVAVSQTHHIMDENKPHLEHAHKEIYEMLGSYDAALAAVIAGNGPYPGILQRWAEYAPWLTCAYEPPLVLEYSEVLADPQRAAARILIYVLKKATELLSGNDYSVDLSPEDLITLSRRMVDATKERSPTFRKGQVGNWRDEFKPEHVELFKKCDPDNWIVKLGFEDSPEWENDRAGEGPGERDPVRDGGQ